MTVCKPWNCTSNLFYHNLPISFTLHVSYLYLSLFFKKKLQMQLDIVDGENDGVIDKIQQILKHRSRNARYTLHKHFNKFDSVEDAKANKTNFENLTQDNWETLCTY